MNLLQHIIWNRRDYTLEAHVSNHRHAVDDIRECSENITEPILNGTQQV